MRAGPVFRLDEALGGLKKGRGPDKYGPEPDQPQHTRGPRAGLAWAGLGRSQLRGPGLPRRRMLSEGQMSRGDKMVCLL